MQVSKTGELIDSMTLTGFSDTEGITAIGAGRFVVAEERLRIAVLVTFVGGTALDRADTQAVKLGTTVGNIGLEGLGYDPITNGETGLGFVGVKESGPLGVFQTTIDFDAGTATNGGPDVENPTDLFDPTLVGTSDLSEVFPLSQVPAIDGGENENLLIISQESGRIVNIDRDGVIANQLDIVDVGAPLSVPAQTMEGVALDSDLVMYTTAEGGGGDASHPQLLVWAPEAPPLARLAVTEVAPWGSDASYGADWFEVTNTGATTLQLDGLKVDDSSNAAGSAAALSGVAALEPGASAIFLEADAEEDPTALVATFGQAWFGEAGIPAGVEVGTYTGSGIGLSSGGDAVNLFDSEGERITGVSFGPSTAGVSFDNTARVGAVAGPVGIDALASEGVFGAFVAVDGEGLGSPGNVATTTPGPGGGGEDLVITEVAPWGSGNGPYAADWFEVTNTGSESVDLTGWKVDDSSALSASAVELVGVSALPAGASAIFYEGTDDAAFELAFAQAWFGQNLFDAGFFFGRYTGGGIGLSTGGDAVTLFDPEGTLVTGVSFGASPAEAPYATFDNVEGLGASAAPFPVVETLSVVDVGGAFLAVDGHGIGSPGSAALDTVDPDPTDALVQNLYEAVLRRPADPAGLTYWVGRIDAGLPAESVAASLARSREGWTRVVEQYYRLALDRDGDPAGVTYWTDVLQVTRAPDLLLADLFGSQEAYRKGGSTTEGYVAYVYARVLDRSVDAGGSAYWTGLIDGSSNPTAVRRQVARTVLFTSEGLRRQVDANHQVVCGVPTPANALEELVASFRASRLNPSLLRATIAIEGCELTMAAS